MLAANARCENNEQHGNFEFESSAFLAQSSSNIEHKYYSQMYGLTSFT